MKKKLIYISILPLDKNNYERFGIEKILNNGWDIEYWIFFGKYSSFFSEKDLFYKKYKNFLVLNSVFNIFQKLNNLKEKNFYFINIGQPWFIERLLTFKGGKKIILDRAGFPEVYNVILNNLFLQKFTFKKYFNFALKVLKIILNKITNRLKPEPSYIFKAGHISGNISHHSKKNTKIINCYSYDYGRFLELKKKVADSNLQNSIVYIDQHLEGNYEFLITDEAVMTSKKGHWNSLEKFLNNLSSKLNKKIIIAGHPKRDKNQNSFLSHEILFDQTANLIKNASLVVGHNSTAASYVALFQKPYICITTNELMKNAYFYSSIKKFSKELGSDLINIDHFNDYDTYNFLKYDKNAYTTYIENYIKTPNVKSENFWLDFINYFENENKN